jgi:hypothetical protein
VHGPAGPAKLRQHPPWLFQDLSTTLQYHDHISSRGSLLADRGEHSASTAKSLTTFRHGSPNTSLVTLIAHLFLPSQAWEYSKLSINTGLVCDGFFECNQFVYLCFMDIYRFNIAENRYMSTRCMLALVNLPLPPSLE